jgi:hypothetical protein
MGKINLVYAGRRNAKTYVYFILEDNKIGEEKRFGGELSKDKTIGAIHEVEYDGKSVLFSKKTLGKYADFENRSQLVTKWRAEDRLVEQRVRAEKELKEIHRFEDFKEFKKWYKSKSAIERQLILVDLVTFLNNTV